MAERVIPALVALLILDPASGLAQDKRPNTVTPETCTGKAPPPGRA